MTELFTLSLKENSVLPLLSAVSNIATIGECRDVDQPQFINPSLPSPFSHEQDPKILKLLQLNQQLVPHPEWTLHLVPVFYQKSDIRY